MMNPKYIVCDGIAHIFAPLITHIEYAHMLNMQKDEITGAGFISFDNNNIPYPYGESVSLRIASSDADIKAIWKIYAPNKYDEEYVL